MNTSIEKELDNSIDNLKKENNIENVNNAFENLNKYIQEFSKIQNEVATKIDIYNNGISAIKNDINKNIYVGNFDINNSEYLGCFEKSDALTREKINMNFQQCKSNAIDKSNPFFSLVNENGNDVCYLGNKLSDIINPGEAFFENIIWTSNENEGFRNIEGYHRRGRRRWRSWTPPSPPPPPPEPVFSATDINEYTSGNTNVQNPILKIFGFAFAVLNYDNTILYTNNYKYITWLISNNKLKQNSESCKLTLNDDGKLVLTNLGGNKEYWNNGVSDNSGVSREIWKPINNPRCKYKTNSMTTGQTISSGESISSNNGTTQLILGNDGILRCYKSTSKCSGNPKIGNDTGMPIYMLDKISYDIKNNESSNANIINNGTYFNISKADCLDICNTTQECKTVEYNSNTNSCTLRSEISNNQPSDNTDVYEKRNISYFDLKSNLGKMGYIDSDEKLYQYNKQDINYSDEYAFQKNTTSTGNSILQDIGDVLTASNKCNTNNDCIAFTFDNSNNQYNLLSDNAWPYGNKEFSDTKDLYLRIPKAPDNNKTCPTNVDVVSAEEWASYDLNGIKNITTNCGVYKFINDELDTLNYMNNKINQTIFTIENITKQYSFYDTEEGKEIKKNLSILKLTRPDIQIKEGYTSKCEKLNNFIDLEKYKYYIGGGILGLLILINLFKNK